MTNDNVINLGRVNRLGTWEYGRAPDDMVEELGPHSLARLNVHDGWVFALIFEHATGFEVRLKFQPNGHRASRPVSWHEIAHARNHLLPLDIGVVATVPAGDPGRDGAVTLFEYPPREVAE